MNVTTTAVPTPWPTLPPKPRRAAVELSGGMGGIGIPDAGRDARAPRRGVSPRAVRIGLIRSYTEPVPLNSLKALARRWWPMLGVVAGVLGYLLWRYLVPDLPRRLFPLLPDNQALYVYADIEAMREAALFSDAASAPGWELIDRRGYFAEYRVFLSKAEVKGAVLSVGEHELRAVLSGRFTAPERSWRTSKAKAGIAKTGPRASPARSILLKPMSDFGCPAENLLEIVDRPPRTVEPADPGNAAFLAAPARQSIREGAVLWMALQPLLPGSRHERSAARYGEPRALCAGPQASHVGLPHSGVQPGPHQPCNCTCKLSLKLPKTPRRCTAFSAA